MDILHVTYISLWIAAVHCCHKNSDCSGGRYCDGGNIFVSGNCIDLIEDGKACKMSILRPTGDGNSCKNKVCTCGHCGAKLDGGYSCTTNGNCKSGWCSPEISWLCTGTCQTRKRNYEECSLEFFDSGDDSSCASGKCLAVSFTKAVCSPNAGFKEGSQCNEDIDCDKTQSLWCKGGAFYATGRCRRCPMRCPDGCNALFNQGIKCGRKTFFEQVAEELRDVGWAVATFFECLVPDRVRSCVADAMRSIKGCLSLTKPCKIRLGGKGSSCLEVKPTHMTYNYNDGPLVMSGYADTTGSFSTELDLSNGKIIIDYSGTIGMTSKIVIHSKKSHAQPTVTKKLYLTNCIGTKCFPCVSPTSSSKCLPKTIFRRPFIIGYMPVILEIKVQIVAFIDWRLMAMGISNISLAYSEKEAIQIKRARASFDVFHGVSLDAVINKNDPRHFLKTMLIRDGIDVWAALRIGPEITFSVNGISINMFTGLRFAIEAKIPKLPSKGNNGSLCLDGYSKIGVGVDVGIGTDTNKITVSSLLSSACSGVVYAACYLEKAVQCMAQAIKTGKANFHPCSKMKSYCSIMEKKIAILLPIKLGNSFYGTDVNIPVDFITTAPQGFKICQRAMYKFKGVSATIGSTKLNGGGGGKRLKSKNGNEKKKPWYHFLFRSDSSSYFASVATVALISMITIFAMIG